MELLVVDAVVLLTRINEQFQMVIPVDDGHIVVLVSIRRDEHVHAWVTRFRNQKRLWFKRLKNEAQKMKILKIEKWLM